MKRQFTIKDPAGLHARPSSLIVAVASRFPNVTLSLEFENESVNLKSIMGVMSMGIGQYSKITINAVGDDSTKALDAIQKVMLDNELI